MENQCYCLVTKLPKLLEPYTGKAIIEKYLLMMNRWQSIPNILFATTEIILVPECNACTFDYWNTNRPALSKQKLHIRIWCMTEDNVLFKIFNWNQA